MSLALGIGANTALFSAINGLLSPKAAGKRSGHARAAAIHRPQRHVHRARATTGRPGCAGGAPASARRSRIRCTGSSSRTTARWRTCSRARRIGRANLVVDGHAEIANAFISTGNYYRMLGLTASPGRTIVPDDDRPDAPPVAVISARYWRTRFGSDPQRRRQGRAVQQRADHDRRRHLAGARRRAAGRSVRVRTSPCRWRSTRSWRAVRRAAAAGTAASRAAPGSADDVVAPGHGTSETRRHRRAGAERTSRRVFQHTARAGFDAYAGVAAAGDPIDLALPEPHGSPAPARRLRRARYLRRQRRRTSAQ